MIAILCPEIKRKLEKIFFFLVLPWSVAAFIAAIVVVLTPIIGVIGTILGVGVPLVLIQAWCLS